MPPKKGEEKVKKVKPPPWLTPEMFELSQNLPALQGMYSGEAKEAKSGGKSGGKALPSISRTEAGLFISQLIFPSTKQANEKREECIKLGVVETSVKIIASQKPADMVSAAHILSVMANSFDQSRQVMLDSKPAVIPQLLTCLANHDSAPLRSAVCMLLRAIATHEDSRPRLWRQLKDWDWSHLIACLQLQDLSQLGGRNAAHDAMAVLDAMCSAPEGDVGAQCCNRVVEHGGIQAIVHVLKDRVSHPMAKAAGVSILNQIMRRAPSSVCEEVVVGAGALQPIINLLGLSTIPLPYKAHAAAVLLRFIMPDSVWRSAILQQGAPLRTGAASSAGAVQTATTENGSTPADDAATAGTNPQVGGQATQLAGKLHNLKLDGSVGFSTSGAHGKAASAAGMLRPSTTQIQDPCMNDDHLLDEATKADIASRAKLVSQGGALKPLVLLCEGPDGPLPDLEAAAADGEKQASTGKSKSKAKGKKGKKGKLEPGVAECQTWASSVLRMVSLDADQRPAVVSAGAVRYLLPLLDSKIHPARWNTRQVLINLSMSAQLLPHLQLYKVPQYIHGANIPARHFERPYPASNAIDNDLQKIPAHLAGAVAAAQRDIQSRGVTSGGGPATFAGNGVKPPALKGPSGRIAGLRSNVASNHNTQAGYPDPATPVAAAAVGTAS